MEESLKKLEIFSVVREAGINEEVLDKEVLEEEVNASNDLLELLANRDRRGRLRHVNLPKVDSLINDSPQTKLSLKGSPASLQWVGGEAGRE